MKNTYYDQNRLSQEPDRRFHAADMERAGGYVQTVPAVVQRLAPQVTVGAWGLSRKTLEMQEDIAEAQGDDKRMLGLRSQKWWVQQWRKRQGLYRVRTLDTAQEAMVERLLAPDGLPAECFPRADDRLAEDNDARIIAEVIALGGTLVLTSNMVMVRDDVLEEWFELHHNQWPQVRVRKLVRRVDELYCEWWRHPLGPSILTRTALAAFWPDDERAPPELVRRHVDKGLQAMARGHFRQFAPLVLEEIHRRYDNRNLEQDIEHVRETLPGRMRQAERERRILLEEGEVQIEQDTSSGLSIEKNIGRYHD